MCPIFSPFILLILILAPSFFLLCSAAVTWTATFNPEDNITIHMTETDTVSLSLYGLDYNELIANNGELHVRSDNDKLLLIDKKIAATEISQQGTWSGKVVLHAIFLGNPNVYVELTIDDKPPEKSNEELSVIIIREVRTIDHVFTGSVATLVSILYINFGAALNLKKLVGILRRPIGPGIGFAGQFVIMPLVNISILKYICVFELISYFFFITVKFWIGFIIVSR